MRITYSIVLVASLLVVTGCKTEIRAGGIGGSTPSDQLDDGVKYFPHGAEFQWSREAETENTELNQ